jgi:hypothetical protein
MSFFKPLKRAGFLILMNKLLNKEVTMERKIIIQAGILILTFALGVFSPAQAVISVDSYVVTCGDPGNMNKLTKIPLTVSPAPQHCAVVKVTGHLKFNIIYGTLTATIFDEDYTTFTPPANSDGTTFISLPNIDENYILIPGLIPLIVNVKFETECSQLEFDVLTDDSTDCQNPIPKINGSCQQSIKTPVDTYDFCYSSYDIPGLDIDYQANCPDFSTNVSCDYDTGQGSTPTAITLSSFKAEPGNDTVTITWTTGDESDNLGFNIYRAAAKYGAYAKINAVLIASKVGSGLGASYAFTDSDVENRKAYYYKLEDVDIYGVKTMHGPVSSTPRSIYGIMQ